MTMSFYERTIYIQCVCVRLGESVNTQVFLYIHDLREEKKTVH